MKRAKRNPPDRDVETGVVLAAKLSRSELHAVATLLALEEPLSAELPSLVELIVTLKPGQREALARAVGRALAARPSEKKRGRRYGKQGHLRALRACARHYGRRPTVRMYTNWRDNQLLAGRTAPYYRSICHIFGSWRAACADAGIG